MLECSNDFFSDPFAILCIPVNLQSCPVVRAKLIEQRASGIYYGPLFSLLLRKFLMNLQIYMKVLNYGPRQVVRKCLQMLDLADIRDSSIPEFLQDFCWEISTN